MKLLMLFSLFDTKEVWEKLHAKCNMDLNEIRWVIAATIWLTALVLISSAFARTDINFGVTGHPLNQTAYNKSTFSYKEQLNLVKKMGMQYYRVHIDVNSLGLVTDPTYTVDLSVDFLSLVTEASNQNINLILVLHIDGNFYKPNLTNNENFANGLYLTTNFCGRYAQNSYFNSSVKVIEVGNELDQDCIISNAYDGSDPSHYNSKINSIANYIVGACKGIRDSSYGIKTMVNTSGWLHYGFLSFVKGVGNYYSVDFDYVGWHWYSSAGQDDITKVGINNINVLNQLTTLFGKEIWITEVNRKDGTLNETSTDSSAIWLQKYAAQMLAHPNVKAFMPYELVDQPLITGFTNYGLLTDKSAPKDSFNTMRFEIEQEIYGYSDYVYRMYWKCSGYDPGANTLATWATYLETTCAGDVSVYFDNWYKIENYAKFVSEQYVLLLGRQPSASETSSTNTSSYVYLMLNSGYTREDVIRSMCSTTEFYSYAGSTNDGFVMRLYTTLLGRPADPGYQTAWVAPLNAGTATRTSTVTAFMSTDDYYNRFINSSFTNFLGRSPNSTESTYHLQSFRQGTKQLTFIRTLCTSDEFWSYAITDGYKRNDTGLTVTSNSPAKAVWSDVIGETSYSIERKTGPNGAYAVVGTTSANVTTFWDTSVSSATTYTYRVKPSNGSYTPEATVTTPTFSTLANESFNATATGSLTSGWTALAPTNTSVSVQAFPTASNKSFRLYDNSTSGLCNVEKTITPSMDWTFATFSFYASANGPTFQLRSGTMVAVDLLLKNGNLVYRNGTGTETAIMTYAANTWYTVKVVPSVSLKSFDLYVGGVKKVMAGAFRNTAVSNIDRVNFGTDTALKSTTYIDDVLIQK
jgi:hypothetical protein